MIVYACADLIFATKIRSTAESLGVSSRPARDPVMLQNRLDRIDDGKANESVSLVLIDLDLADVGLRMIEQVKQHDPQIPVLAFGAHVARELLAAADQAGADRVMPRGAFVNELPTILKG